MHKPDGLTVVPSDPTPFVRSSRRCPSAKSGVSARSANDFGTRGFRVVANCNARPRAPRAVLGPAAAAHLFALAHGEDAREVEATWDEKSISREHTFS